MPTGAMKREGNGGRGLRHHEVTLGHLRGERSQLPAGVPGKMLPRQQPGAPRCNVLQSCGSSCGLTWADGWMDGQTQCSPRDLRKASIRAVLGPAKH